MKRPLKADSCSHLVSVWGISKGQRWMETLPIGRQQSAAKCSPSLGCSCELLLCTPLPGNQSQSAVGNGPLPQASNCQWVTVSGNTQPRWSSGRQWGKRWIPAFSAGPSSSSSLGPAGDLGAQGTGGRLCPAVLQSPHRGTPAAGPRPWGSGDPLPASATSRQLSLLGRDLQDLHAPHMGHLSSLRAGWVGCLVPSALMAEQGLRTRPWGHCQLSSNSARTGLWRG